MQVQNIGTMNKPTKLQQEMFAVIEDFQQSGLTRLAFCAQRSIAITKFHYWQKKYRDHSNGTPNGFIQLTSRKSHRSGELLAPIVLQYPNGVSLQLPGGTPMATLRTLLSLV